MREDDALKAVHSARRGYVTDDTAIAACCKQLLDVPKRKQPEEKLEVAEQAALSAAASGDAELARNGADVLLREFPQSNRSARCDGVALESAGHLEKAYSLYKRCLNRQEADQRILRRLAAIERSRNKPKDAIKQLCAYLDTFSADIDAWIVLGWWYAEQMAHTLSCFCFEEVLLAQPQDQRIHCLVAESAYTCGDITAARHHFAAACHISNGCNVRSLIGLVLCGAGGSNKDLPLLAASQLLTLYESSAPLHLPLMRALVQAKDLEPRTLTDV